MTADAEVEAQIRARDTEDYETGLDVAGWDRRALLHWLLASRKELADSRRREQEARDAWVAMRAQRDRVLAERDGLLRKWATKRKKVAS